jgi:hypothetical protein
MNRSSDLASVQAVNRRLGLLFGLLMSAVFTLVAWGVDAIGLAGLPGQFPWLKLGVGGVVCVLIGAYVGWLVARLDHGAVGLIAWGLAGILISMLAAHLPYEGYSIAAGIADPRFGSLDAYPFVAAAGYRQSLATLMIAGLYALAGLVQPVLFEQARGAASRLSQVLALLMAAPAFALAGYIADDFYNQPLRQPQQTLAGLVRNVLDNTQLTRQERLDLHIGGLNPVIEMLTSPHMMMVSSYDTSTLTSLSVEVEFDSGWAHCHLISAQLSVCQPSDALLSDALLCLLRSPEIHECRAQAAPATEAWLDQARSVLGAQPSLRVVGRAGTLALVEGVGETGVAFRCLMRGSMPTVVEDCALDGMDLGSPSTVGLTAPVLPEGSTGRFPPGAHRRMGFSPRTRL